VVGTPWPTPSIRPRNAEPIRQGPISERSGSVDVALSEKAPYVRT
jgi:hypothetical protein